MKDVICLRDAIVSSGSNMHQPMDLLKRMKSLNRSEDVNKALMMMLSEQASLGDGILLVSSGHEARTVPVGHGLLSPFLRSLTCS